MESSEASAVYDFLEILLEHQKNCEKQGKYVEAEIAKNRAEELKLHEENRRREELRAKHIKERLGLEESHMADFKEKNEEHDKKMASYELLAEELVESMKQRHIAELKEFQNKIEDKQIKPKLSKELLNLRKIQETLAKRKDYAEAHKMKLKADALEVFEMEKWQTIKQHELLQREAQFKHLKQQELSALQKKIQSDREKLKKERHLAIERLLQKYQNVKSELEAQQNLEKVRLEKLVQSGIFNNTKLFGKSNSKRR
eukprot:gene20284-26331_t